MRRYENVFILLPDLQDEEISQSIERYRTVLTDNGAEMLRVDEWGRRKMAYEINNQTKGYYVLFEFISTSEPIVELERQMRLDDTVIRFLTIKQDDAFDREEYEARKAAAEVEEAKRQAEASDDEEAETEDNDEDDDSEDAADEAPDKEESEA